MVMETMDTVCNMNSNEKLEAILALRHEVPDMKLTITTGIAPVVIHLDNVYVGGGGYILTMAGFGETMEDAIDDLIYRLLVDSGDYVLVDINMKGGPRWLRFKEGSWRTVTYEY